MSIGTKSGSDSMLNVGQYKVLMSKSTPCQLCICFMNEHHLLAVLSLHEATACKSASSIA